ncbi:hypothetical protein ONS96_010197 [Cadophora gregata f. sp. sojae]|nr:hypothetical protein ONS96_010197 [Cadophora gregata f. sp. sojae]
MTENRVAEVRRGSGAGNGQLKAKKVRTPKSCDRCKSRKTKCIDPGSSTFKAISALGFFTCNRDHELTF